jgi:hypothetical protein
MFWGRTCHQRNALDETHHSAASQAGSSSCTTPAGGLPTKGCQYYYRSRMHRLSSQHSFVHLQFQQQSSVTAAAPATAQKALVAGKYLLGLGGVAAASQSETVAEKAHLAYLIPVRLIRDVYTAASIVTGEERMVLLPACLAGLIGKFFVWPGWQLRYN